MIANTNIASVNEKLLNLFKKAIVCEHDKTMSFKQVNELAVLNGYIIPEQLCVESVYLWLEKQKIDYTKTFYRQWEDVINKSRFELFIDQLIHYSSTYGTEFEGDMYIPNEDFSLPSTAFSSLIPITVTTIESVSNSIIDTIYSGVPLKQETIDSLFYLIKTIDVKYDINKVVNKEIKMFMYESLNIIPTNPEECVRYLVYKLTGKCLVIKDKKTISTIKAVSDKSFVTKYINKVGMNKMASVFYRYKELFLAMKCSSTSYTINKLRRLAKKEHKAYVKDLCEIILNQNAITEDTYSKLKNITVFKKIKLLNTIDIRLMYDKTKQCDVYKIRNGKIYTKTNRLSYNTDNIQYLKELRNIIYLDLVKYMSNNRCRVRLPKDIILSAPSSEKTFVGDIPFGSYIPINNSDSFIMGVYWDSHNGIRDLDLSGIKNDGEKIGWNGSYNIGHNNTLYSGDVTNGINGANEYIKFNSIASTDKFIMYANVYGFFKDRGSFDVFIAKSDTNDHISRELIDKNKILHRVELSTDMFSRELCIGVVSKDKFIFMNMIGGTDRISSYRDYSLKFLNRIIDTESVSLTLHSLLRDSGFDLYDHTTTDDVDIDLSVPSKIDILKLFKKN